MTLYASEVTFKETNAAYYQVDADDEADASFQILELAKEDYPDAIDFEIDTIEKVNKD